MDRKLSLRALCALIACVGGLILAGTAPAGTQLAPVDGGVVGGTPAFAASLTNDDNHPRAVVTTAAGTAVGSCDLAPGGAASACRLQTVLPPGDYSWTLVTDYLFCDGDAGQYCDEWRPRLAGPVDFTVHGGLVAVVPADSPVIVAGSSIGAIRIGMSEQEVLAAYGRPRTERVSAAATAARRSGSYVLHGGIVRVGYLDSRVVSISTTSRWYRTPTGLAVGAPAPGGGFQTCGALLVQRSVAGATALLVSRHRIAEIRIEALAPRCS